MSARLPTRSPRRLQRREQSARPRLSIVVLPFANIGGDPEQEHFVDGVTENLTTDLSRIRGAFVIARNTAFTYKGKPFDVKADRPRFERPLCPRRQRSARRKPNARQRPARRRRNRRSPVGRTVRQAARRSLRHAGRNRRAPGRQRWTPSSSPLRRDERNRRRLPNSMDLYFQGSAWLNKGTTADNVAQARSFFDRALIADPDNVDALVGSARAQTLEGGLLFGGRPNDGIGSRRSEIDQSLVVSSGRCARTPVPGIRRHLNQARCRGHRGM